MQELSFDQKLEKATKVVCKQGMFPFPINKTTKAIIKTVVDEREDELDLICAFTDRPSQTMDQLRESSGFPEERIEAMTSSLAQKGLIFNPPNSANQVIFRLLPLMNTGILEYTFMKPFVGDRKAEKLAELFETLLEELKDEVQNNYDQYLPLFEASPPAERTVPIRTSEEGTPISIIPIDQKVDMGDEYILPSQSVKEIIQKFDDIAVGHCHCRQRQKILGNSLAANIPTFNCFTFGKSARHTVAQGFAKQVTKEQAFAILEEAQAAGLVHKAYHPGSDETKLEVSLCNCDKHCCELLATWRKGALPLINATYHLAKVDPDLCVGCGICEEKCPTEAIKVCDTLISEVQRDYCFGCGVCAHFCPAGAISLKEGLRKVYIPPPKMR